MVPSFYEGRTYILQSIKKEQKFGRKSEKSIINEKWTWIKEMFVALKWRWL